MYKQAEGFQPVPDDAILWRYQDITRYIDLLLKRQLFFSRADKFKFNSAFSVLEGFHNSSGYVRDELCRKAADFSNTAFLKSHSREQT